MRNILLSVVVVAVLIAGGVGGTMAGFVDTEESKGNTIQAGILDLLVNGKNDPVGAKLTYTHAVPCVSQDFWVDLFSWSECQGAKVYMQLKNIVSEEAGTKLHDGGYYVYDGVAQVGGDIPDGYRTKTGNEPIGIGVYSSEPEKIAEAGGGEFGQYVIGLNDPTKTWEENLALVQGLGEDYASGVSDHLNVTIEVPHVGPAPTPPAVCDMTKTLGNPDTGDGAGGDPDGQVDAAEYAAWEAAGNHWCIVYAGKLNTLTTNKKQIGFMVSQTMTFVHLTVHLQQIEDTNCTNDNVKYWPTNALQGDKATWDMLFELNTD